MARPREFDEERAVDAAMRVFWANGYEATSTEDLCAATGLGRSSIYNAFTSKHVLFETALARYMEQKSVILTDLREGDEPVRDKLRRYMEWTMSGRGKDPLGCLVVNSMIELAPKDQKIAAMLNRDYRERRDALQQAFELARAKGELGADKDLVALADFVIATISGMRVAERAGADEATLERVAGIALAAI